MLNLQKTKILTKASLYENAEGRVPIKYNNYCTEKSVIKRLVRSLPFGSLLYLLLLIVVTVASPNWLVDLRASIHLSGVVILLFAVMIVFVLIYCLISKVVIEYKYQDVRSSLLKYRLHIRHLKKIYEDEERKKTAENKLTE